jgi:hypothetical protein
MFKRIATSILLVSLALLSACSNLSITSLESSLTSVVANQTTGSSDSSTQNKLGIGILLLENTDQAITADQANALLPLWKAVRSLTNDDNTSSAEITALYNQIQESLTAEQVKEIQQLTWTQEDLITIQQRYGAQIKSNRSGNSEAVKSQSSSLSSGGGMPGGDMGGGMPGGDMDSGMSGGNISGVVSSGQTQQVSNSTRPATGNNETGLNYQLADTVITLLQQRIAA